MEVVPFTHTPTCINFTPFYTYEVVDPVDFNKRSTIPPFVNNAAGSRTLFFNTENELYCGTYRIAVKGTQSSLTAESYFNLLLLPLECKTEQVSPDGIIGPIDYSIGSGVVNLKPTWTSSVSRITCPTKFKIYMLQSDGSKSILTTAEQ